MEIRLVTHVRGRHSSHDARRDNAALLQTNNLRFAQIDDHEGHRFLGPSTSRRRVKAIENLITGERHVLEWGGVRLRIDQQQDPALLFRCFA